VKTTTHTLRKLKGQRPIVAVTAYDALIARLAGEAEVDLILVGDSVGNALLGFDNTLPVTLDMMAHHTAAVARAKPAALLAADVPFIEAHFDFERVLRGCQRLIQEAGAEAVKIEGGLALAPAIARLVEAGVPVWGHLGLKPQQVHTLGRYKKFGVDPAEAEGLLADALALEKAGAFALLLEMVEPNLARTLTETVRIPTIGIGSGPHCDGQILVCTDLLGLAPGSAPPFARAFAQAGEEIKKGFAAYAAAVRARKFPE
jgi:3-methyl-2-oxobutanoate hydroxymethyltransferase